MQLTPGVTAAVGVTTSGAGAFVAYLLSLAHAAPMPDAAAGFVGACLVGGGHLLLVKLKAEPPDEIPAAPAAPAAPAGPAPTLGGIP